MTTHTLFTFARFLLLGSFLLACTPSGETAVAVTKRGTREGRIIVREFDRLVITIVTPDKRLFQYYARDIESITATEKVLVGEKTPMREKPAKESDAVTDLSHGLEVTILETSQDKEWVKVKGWGNNEGWIPSKVLTDKVVFTPEEKQESPKQPAAANPVQPASAAVSAATPEVALPVVEAATPTVMPATAAVIPAKTVIPATTLIPTGAAVAPIPKSASAAIPSATAAANNK